MKQPGRFYRVITRLSEFYETFQMLAVKKQCRSFQICCCLQCR